MPIFVLLLGLLIAGAFAGLLAGLLGIGGGIVIVPALFTLFSVLEVDPAVRMPLAVGTSLSTIIVTATMSARSHYHRGAVDLALLRSWAPWILVGVIIGSVVARFAPQGVMLLVFATVALIVAGYMALAPEGVRLADDLPRGPVRWVIASLIGGVSSIMGIGGGTLSVPTLTLCSYPVRRAVGTGAAIGLLIAVPATVGMMAAGWGRVGLPTGSIGFVNVLGFAVLVPMTALMAPVGVRLAHRIPPRWLRRAFAAFLLLTALRMYADWFALA
ncbi:MAG: sulfite exporter TauE/SafE family protein [Trueperaceae bacterium]|nr:sulfite exporter TauE/SafE family protein [Trueperaceae bacterium]